MKTFFLLTTRCALASVVIGLFASLQPFAPSFAPSMASSASATQGLPPATCGLPNVREAGTYDEPGDGGFVAGDFNNDGKRDLAVVNVTDKRITLFYGDGAGAFSKGPSVTTPDAPALAREGDFNGDGRSDLVVLSGIGNPFPFMVNTLGVYLSNAQGALTAGQRITFAESFPPDALLTGALNFDTRTDVVVAGGGLYERMQVYFAQADGSLQAGFSDRFIPQSQAHLVDFNSDGVRDLVVAQYQPGKVFFYSGNGGNIGARTELFSSNSVIVSSAIGDVDLNGKRDVVFTTGSSFNNSGNVGDTFKLQVARQNETSGFSFTISGQNLPVDLTPRLWQLRDLNDDQRPDAIFINKSLIGEPREFAINNGASAFCQPILQGVAPLTKTQLAEDLNNDGRMDFVTLNNQQFTVWLNRGGTATPTAPTVTPVTNVITQGRFEQLRLATVSDTLTPATNLRVDIVTLPSGISLTQLAINDSGQLQGITGVACDVTPNTYNLTLRVTNQAGLSTTATIPLNVTAARPPTIRSAPASIAMREGVSQIVALIPPFDSDIDPLVIPIHYGDDANTSLSNYQVFLDGQIQSPISSPGRFRSHYFITPTAASRTLRVVLTDFCNRQTVRDIPLVVAGASADCAYPVFAPGQSYESTANVPALVVSDFNNDRRTDVVLWDATANRLKTYLGQANGELRLAASFAAQRYGGSLVAADFNQDGRFDLAMSYPAIGSTPSERGVTILSGNGDGTFTFNRDYDIGQGRLVTGDLNNDNYPDLVVADARNSTFSVLLNNRNGVFTTNTLPSIPVYSTDMMALAHLNNDNFLDLAVAGKSEELKPALELRGDGLGGLRPVTVGFPGSGNLDYVHTTAFNNAGRAGIALSYGSNLGDINLTTNSFKLPGLEPLLNLTATSIATADFTRDGNLDIALNDGILISGKTQPLCARAKPRGLPVFVLVATGDFDGDGRPDLAGTTGNNNGFRVFLNRTNTAATVSAANYTGVALAPEQIVATFGVNLAPSTQTARTVPLPTNLAGTQVRVTDSTGQARLAPLFFVSSGQVNFQIPPGTALGTASVEIIGDNGGFSASSVNIATASPGLFTAAANGKGVAAAQVLRIGADNVLRYQQVARLNASNQWEAIPIDLSNAAEQVFLVLYGTGIRGRSSPTNIATTIGGVACETLYAGAQGSLVGLDQVNVRLPRTLAGRGEVDVAFTADGKAANMVRVNFK